MEFAGSAEFPESHGQSKNVLFNVYIQSEPPVSPRSVISDASIYEGDSKCSRPDKEKKTFNSLTIIFRPMAFQLFNTFNKA